jgi:aminomethyltransferase
MAVQSTGSALAGLGTPCAETRVNFFFNTKIGPDGRVIEVEPALSRPGDYVLMRAEVDLLVASSACPDDIGPTNGFNPTEIMVRVFPPPAP